MATLTKDLIYRPTAKQALRHSFFREIHEANRRAKISRIPSISNSNNVISSNNGYKHSKLLSQRTQVPGKQQAKHPGKVNTTSTGTTSNVLKNTKKRRPGNKHRAINKIYNLPNIHNMNVMPQFKPTGLKIGRSGLWNRERVHETKVNIYRQYVLEQGPYSESLMNDVTGAKPAAEYPEHETAESQGAPCHTTWKGQNGHESEEIREPI